MLQVVREAFSGLTAYASVRDSSPPASRWSARESCLRPAAEIRHNALQTQAPCRYCIAPPYSRRFLRSSAHPSAPPLHGTRFRESASDTSTTPSSSMTVACLGPHHRGRPDRRICDTSRCLVQNTTEESVRRAWDGLSSTASPSGHAVYCCVVPIIHLHEDRCRARMSTRRGFSGNIAPPVRLLLPNRRCFHGPKPAGNDQLASEEAPLHFTSSPG